MKRVLLAAVLFALCAGLLLSCGCSQRASKSDVPATAVSDTKDLPPVEEVEQIVTLTESGKTMAIEVIEEYPEVLDAAGGQDGTSLSLALIVRHGTSIERGKELGDNFVRLVKSLGFTGTPTGEEPPIPGKRIGKGPFTYLIGVYYPDETQLALGAKVAGAENISW